MNPSACLNRWTRLRLVSCTTGLLCAAVLRGQTASTDRPSSHSDEPISLSEFTVTAESQTGYTASESMSGSRIPTRVKDLPFNVDVITSDFANDFLILDYSQTVQGGMVTQDLDAGASYTVRGITASGQLYDGFWLPAGTPVPAAFRQRTEILNGPSAGVYGQTAPGGMINIVPIVPKFNPYEMARVSFGTYNLFDGRIEATGPISSKTAYLFMADDYNRAFNQPWHEDRNKSYEFSILHKFDDTSSLRVDLVTSFVRNTSPSNRVPYYFNSVTSTYYGIAYPLMKTSGTGPFSYKNTDNYSVFSVYEKRLSDVFSLRMGAHAFAVNLRSFNTTDTTSYDPDPSHAGTNPFGTPFYGLTRLRSASSSFSAPSYQKNKQEGAGYTADLLAHSWLFNHTLDNRSLLTLEYHTYYQYILKSGMPQSVKTSSNGLPTLSSAGAPSVNNADDPAIFPPAPTAAVPNNYWLPVINPLGPIAYTDPASGLPVDIYNIPGPGSGLYQIKSWQKTREDTFGVMYRDQATLWDKLHLYGDIRFDNVMYNVFVKQYPNYSLSTYPTLASYVATAYPGNGGTTPGYQGSIVHTHADSFSGSGGASYALPFGISAYANYSTSFNPSSQPVSGATTGAYLLPNETARGYDYGFKGSVIDDRLTFTTGGYYITQQHVSVTANDANGLAIKQAVGSVVSRGLDLSANFFVTPQLALNAAYYYTDARWQETGNDLDMSGRARADVPKDIVTAAAKYSFTGALRGLRVFAAFNYTGKAHAEERGNLTASGGITPVGSNNGLREIIIPPTRVANVGTSYSWDSNLFGSKFTHMLQFNIGNVGNHPYVTYSRGSADKRTFDLSYQLSH
jgi:iron complex outermembrane receptor protein